MAYQGDDRYGADRWRDREPGGRSGERGGYRDLGRGDYGRNDYRSDYERGGYRQGEYGRGGYGRDDRDRSGYGRGDPDDRGFFDRAGDELRSWFGDEEAQRRREEDYRRWEREQRMTGARSNQDRYGAYGSGSDRSGSHEAYGDRAGGGWGNQRGESWHRDRPGEPGWLGGSSRDEGYGRTRASGGGGASSEDQYGYDRAPGGSAGFGRSGYDAGYGGRGFPSRSGQTGAGRHDDHYSMWRQRQIDEIDRDYDEYRREHQSQFEQEFGSWRSKRQGQRQSLNRVNEHMDVVGSDGSHVGTVDKVRGDRIILTRSDPSSGGVHHSIPCSWVETVDDKVTLNKSADEAKLAWRSEDRSRALFEREDSGSDGPGILNRSFAGTYDTRGQDSTRSERDKDE